jgi:hypothetical protein
MAGLGVQNGPSFVRRLTPLRLGSTLLPASGVRAAAMRRGQKCSSRRLTAIHNAAMAAAERPLFDHYGRRLDRV